MAYHDKSNTTQLFDQPISFSSHDVIYGPIQPYG